MAEPPSIKKRSSRIQKAKTIQPPRYLRSLVATGVHGKFDLHQEFEPGLNILFGRNGTGKTTLLHIIANLLNGDIARFPHLHFQSIEAEFDNGKKAKLVRTENEEEGYVGIDLTFDAKISIEMVFEAVIDNRDSAALYANLGIPSRRARYRPVHMSFSGSKSQATASERTGRVPPSIPTAYFPAFRTMIEAWSSVREETDVSGTGVFSDAQLEQRLRATRNRIAHGRPIGTDAVRSRATLFARDLFGEFVPDVNYPSTVDIEWRLNTEIRRALLRVGEKDRELLSKAFLDVFTALGTRSGRRGRKPADILDEIRALFLRVEESALISQVSPEATLFAQLREQVESIQLQVSNVATIVRILEIYRKSLEERVTAQETAFEGIKRYLASVNSFLEGKQLRVIGSSAENPSPSVAIEFANKTRSRLQILSSGEREIVTLIYAATRMTSEHIVLIDEPELSLHIDWQRDLLREMSNQLPDRQIIACTHSPVIGADHLSRKHELMTSPTDPNIHPLKLSVIPPTDDDIDPDDIPF